MADERGPGDPGSMDSERKRWAMIHRFLDGLGTLPERREVERLMSDDLSVKRYIKAHQKVWSMIGRRMGPTPIDLEDAWDSLEDNIAENVRQSRFDLPGRGREHLRILDGGRVPRVPRRVRAWAVTRAAAVILCGAFLATLGHLRNRPALESPGQATIAAVAFTTQRGQEPNHQQLPDGTDFVLAPSSQLNFTVDHDGTHRVKLVGEASFSVRHRSDRVFVVSAAGIETRDLGTEFDVQAYPGSTPRVAVRSGRVSMRAPRGTAVVDGGFVASIDANGAPIVSRVPPGYFDWTLGRLVFSGASLSEIAAGVGRVYDLDISIPDSMLSAHSVTITLPPATARETLAHLAAVAGLQYELDGRKARLFRR